MARTLLLSLPSADPKELVIKANREKGPVSWVFMCQDYRRYSQWKERMPKDFREITLGQELQGTALALKEPFLSLISDLGEKYGSPAWWASRVSERNTMVSYLFLYCCYLKFLSDRLGPENGVLCIVGENPIVLMAVSDIAKDRGFSVKWIERPLLWQIKFRYLLRSILRLLRIMARAILKKSAGTGYKPARSDQGTIAIHTYVDEKSFGEKGDFNDRYFPGLHAWLAARGFNVVTIPFIFNIKRSIRAAWNWFRGSKSRFINPYNYYTLSDYIFAFRESLKQMRMPEGKIILAGLDITRLFNNEKWDKAFAGFEALLYYRLPKRLVEKGIKIDLMVEEYENMINEKMIISGIREYMPLARVAGFQHGALYPLFLCNFITRKESVFAPLPDRVVCNGELFREIMVKEGLPEEKTATGPALRYSYLWEMDKHRQEGGEKDDILVPLPLVESDAIELLAKLKEAFRGDEKLRISVKPHPMSSKKLLERIGQMVPSNFKIVHGSMADRMFKTRILAALSSCTIFEAFAAGVPVLVVGREFSLDLNPLGFFPEHSRVFYEPGEIKKEALRLLSLSSAQLETYRQQGRKILEKSFGPVNDSTMSAFIDGLIEERSGIE